MPDVQIDCTCGGPGEKSCPECKGGGTVWVDGEECLYCACGEAREFIQHCEHCEEGPLCRDCYKERDCCPDAIADNVIPKTEDEILQLVEESDRLED